MTEWEKCYAGELYDTNFPGREEQHLACADLCWEYNRTRPSDLARRDELIRRIFGAVGKDVYVEPNLFCGFGFNISVGDGFYANNNCCFVDPARIAFGAHVFLGPNCGFYTANHPVGRELRNRMLEYALPITVGSDVWIGGNTVVLPGVTIGSDVVIGAGSVVTKDVPDHVVAFGNPCAVRRAITPEDRERRG